MDPKPLSTSSATQWLPNHKRVPVTVDALGGYILSVTSSEPDSGLGNGDWANDSVIIPPVTVKLRAERKNTGAERIYSILVQLSDGSQNVLVVRVPHDQSNH